MLAKRQQRQPELSNDAPQHLRGACTCTSRESVAESDRTSKPALLKTSLPPTARRRRRGSKREVRPIPWFSATLPRKVKVVVRNEEAGGAPDDRAAGDQRPPQ